MSPTSLAGRTLQWNQVHASPPTYEVRNDTTVVGTLTFRSGLGTFATAGTASGGWTMKRVGFFNTRVEIRPVGSETAIATFRQSTWGGGGTLELSGGRTLRADAHFWQSSFDVKDAEGRELVRCTAGWSFFRDAGELALTQTSAALPETLLIAFLTLYLVIMMRREATAAGAAAAVAAG